MRKMEYHKQSKPQKVYAGIIATKISLDYPWECFGMLPMSNFYPSWNKKPIMLHAIILLILNFHLLHNF